MPVLFSFSQQNNAYIDSIRTELNKHPLADTNRINLLVAVSNAIYHSKPEEAMKYDDEAILLSEKIKWQQGLANAHRVKGVIYYIRSDYLNALQYFQLALKEHGENRDRFEATIFSNIALIYMEMGNFQDALSNYHKSLSMAYQFGWKREEAIAVMNIGLIKMKEDKFDSAIIFYDTSIHTALEIGDKQVLAYALTNKGAALEKSGHYNEAIETFQKSIPFADSMNDSRIKAQALGGLAEAYIFKKDYDEAEKYALASLALGKQLNILQYQKEMYQLLSDLYVAKKQTDKAFDSYKTYISLRDSIMNDDKKSEMVKLEMRYEQEKQQATSAAEISRQKLVRNAIITGAFILLFAALISFAFYKKRRDAKQMQKEAEFNAQVSDTEMKALRAQMNPHFIFNSLNSISDYISKNNLQAADNYLTKFAKLMRSILENSEQKEVSLTEDLKALELYMQLESLRMNNKFTYEIKVDPGIDKENTQIPPLILQPFVENSIWHGIAKKEGNGKILVHIEKEGEMINCIVEDDGIGIQTATAASTEKKSLGMKITNSRINIINKTKKTNASVQLSSLQQGTRAEVKLPLQLSF